MSPVDSATAYERDEIVALVECAVALLERELPVEAHAVGVRLAEAAHKAADPTSATTAEVWSHLLRAEVDTLSADFRSAIHHLHKAKSAALAVERLGSGADLHLGIGAALLELGNADDAHAELTVAWTSGDDLSPMLRARCAFLLMACAAKTHRPDEHGEWFDRAMRHVASCEDSTVFIRRRVDAARFIGSDGRPRPELSLNETRAAALDRASQLLSDCTSDLDRAGRSDRAARARIVVARANLGHVSAPLGHASTADLKEVTTDEAMPLDARIDALVVLCEAAVDPADLARAMELCRQLLEAPGLASTRSRECEILGRLESLARRQGDQQLAFGYLRRLVTVRSELSAEEADRAGAVTAFQLEGDRLRGDARRAGDRVAELEASNRALVAHAEQLERDSATDRLTGLGNRRALERYLTGITRDWPNQVSVAIVDADLFKHVNDQFGHAIGDAVLQRLAATLLRTIRVADLVSRVGGEEFAVVLRGAGPADAADAAEGIRVAVEQEPWGDIVPGLSVTVSIGVATAASPDTLRDAFRQADQRLYEAKDAGRNTVIADVDVLRHGPSASRSERLATSSAPPDESPQGEHASLHRLRLDAWDAFDRWDHDRVRSIVGEWRSCEFVGQGGANALAWAFDAQLAVREERERDAIEASEMAALADDHNDDAISIDVHAALGYVCANLGECDRAMEHLGTAWLGSASAGTDTQQARIAYLMALALQMLEHYEHALSWHERGRRHAIIAGADLLRVRWTLNEHETMLDVAKRLQEQGRHEEARQLLQQVVAGIEALRPEMVALDMTAYVQAASRMAYARTIDMLGDTEQAIAILDEAIEGWHEGTPAELFGFLLTNVAELHLRAGDAATARQYCDRALGLTRTGLLKNVEVNVVGVAADVAAALGLYDQAADYLRAQLEIRSQLAHERAVERARVSETRSELQILSHRTETQRALAHQLSNDRERLLSDMQRLRCEAERDPLTGLPNRAAIEGAVTDRLAGGSTTFALVMLDVDHFKAVNDTYGHATGDAVLTRLSALLHRSCRSDDLVGRWGGDEFIAILDIQSRSAARRSCDRLRRAVAAAGWSDLVDLLEVRISVGASMSRDGDDLRSLFERADASLYTAKRAGRDFVVIDATTHELGSGGEAVPFEPLRTGDVVERSSGT